MVEPVNTEQLLARLRFRSENFVEDVCATTVKKESFDVVLCLSTIKWVHFTFGDVGVKALFLKVHEQLVSGGLFVFEPQPWKSYKKILSDKQKPLVESKEKS